MPNGRSYEQFVKTLQEAIIYADLCEGQKNITIETNKKIKDNCNIEREFDLYWEYELGGFTYKTVIECKDYNSPITVEKIDALIGKIKDIPDLKPAFATKTGYQRGAKIKAKYNKIDLLIVRQQNESDWIDEDGTPLLREITFNLHIVPSIRLLVFQPDIDKQWARNNGFSEGVISITGERVTIENISKNEKYGLLELLSKLKNSTQGKTGKNLYKETLDDGYILWDDKKLKIRSYKVEYYIPTPIIMNFSIDFQDMVAGVIEYLNQKNKKIILKDSTVRSEKIK